MKTQISITEGKVAFVYNKNAGLMEKSKKIVSTGSFWQDARNRDNMSINIKIIPWICGFNNLGIGLIFIFFSTASKGER
jgi:hypothetical protein